MLPPRLSGRGEGLAGCGKGTIVLKAPTPYPSRGGLGVIARASSRGTGKAFKEAGGQRPSASLMISTPREAARGAAEGLSAALHCIEDSRQAKTGRG